MDLRCGPLMEKEKEEEKEEEEEVSTQPRTALSDSPCVSSSACEAPGNPGAIS